MIHLREIRLGDLLARSGEAISVESEARYRTAGIRSFGKGIFERSTIFGSETKYTTLWRTRHGQLVFSKLFAWEGAIAVAAQEHDGLLFSGEFPIFDIDDSQLLPEFAVYLAQWTGLHERLRANTTGVGNRRQRVNPDRFLSVTVPVPEIADQRRIVCKLERALTVLPGITQRSDIVQSALASSMLNSLFSRGDFPTRTAGEILRLERDAVEVDPLRDYRYIGMRSFGNGIIHYTATLGSNLSKLRYFSFPVGAVLRRN